MGIKPSPILFVLVCVCAILALIASTLRPMTRAAGGDGVVRDGDGVGFVAWQPQQHQQKQRRRQLLSTTPPPSPQSSRETLFFKHNDPRTVEWKGDGNDLEEQRVREPLSVCSRAAPIPFNLDVQISQKYERCPLLSRPPEKTTILLIAGVNTFGRTGNNLIEFFHAIQYGKDRGVLVAISWGSWALQLLTNMWMSVPYDSDEVRAQWAESFERAFCVKILHNYLDYKNYGKVIQMDTKDLFLYKHRGLLKQYVEFQGSLIRTLYRSANDGTGINIRRKQVNNMCSVLDAMFGEEKGVAKYAVIHSRSLEGEPGLRLLGRIARTSGCDPVAALEMEPEYIKGILGPLGMMDIPILFITDRQRPEILKRLLDDPEIGPQIRLIPSEASWVGGDITAATMADVFIGNPASSFSGFIAKSRVALGYSTTYMFRKRRKNGVWYDVRDDRSIFDNRIMSAMA